MYDYGLKGRLVRLDDNLRVDEELGWVDNELRRVDDRLGWVGDGQDRLDGVVALGGGCCLN